MQVNTCTSFCFTLCNSLRPYSNHNYGAGFTMSPSFSSTECKSSPSSFFFFLYFSPYNFCLTQSELFSSEILHSPKLRKDNFKRGVTYKIYITLFVYGLYRNIGRNYVHLYSGSQQPAFCLRNIYFELKNEKDMHAFVTVFIKKDPQMEDLK